MNWMICSVHLGAADVRQLDVGFPGLRLRGPRVVLEKPVGDDRDLRRALDGRPHRLRTLLGHPFARLGIGRQLGARVDRERHAVVARVIDRFCNLDVHSSTRRRLCRSWCVERGPGIAAARAAFCGSPRSFSTIQDAGSSSLKCALTAAGSAAARVSAKTQADDVFSRACPLDASNDDEDSSMPMIRGRAWWSIVFGWLPLEIMPTALPNLSCSPRVGLLRHAQSLGHRQRASPGRHGIPCAGYDERRHGMVARTLRDAGAAVPTCLSHLRAMSAAVDLPLNADFEKGFCR